MPKKKHYKTKKNKQSDFKRKSKNKKYLILALSGIAINVVLCVTNVLLINAFTETSEKLSNYRQLQDKQISSVKELCFDIGISNSIVHNTYSQERTSIMLIMAFAKNEYSEQYNNAYAEICYKPLLLISGKEFEGNGSTEEKAKELLTDKATGDATNIVNNSKYTVVDNAFDKVRW